MVSILVSADDIKTGLPGYTPDRAGEFHTESAKLADKKFYEHLGSFKHEAVVLMSGGPASGKTEFVTEYLMDKNYLILDGILPTEIGAKIKIEKIKKIKKKIVIYAVWPLDLKQAYMAFLHRDRKFGDEHFFQKHYSARKTLLWIAENYRNIDIRIVINSYIAEDLRFTELQFDSRQELVDHLEENQYYVSDIIKEVTE